MAGKKDKLTFGTCRDCGKQSTKFHVSHTSRNTTVVICYDCMKKYQRGETANARDS